LLAYKSPTDVGGFVIIDEDAVGLGFIILFLGHINPRIQS